MNKEKKSFLAIIGSKNTAYIGLVSIFAVLLLQSGFSLFVTGPADESFSAMDTVFRTALSSIFGYIMSRVSVDSVTQTKTKKGNNPTQTKQIGFTIDNPSTPQMLYSEDITKEGTSAPEIVPTTEPTLPSPISKRVFINAQIIILTISCVYCLGAMIFMRNFSQLTTVSTSAIVTIAMYRDIISGTIGALIGLSQPVQNES